MANVTMSKFLGDWTKSITKPFKEKLTPEFELLDTIYDGDAMSSGRDFRYSYTGDGALSLSYPETSAGVMFFSSYNKTPTIYISINGHNQISGTATVTSAETDNYKAGEWTFDYLYGYF